MNAIAPTLLILGRGRLGRSLDAAGRHAGLEVELRPSREPLPAAALRADLVLLAVPDQEVRATAARLATADDLGDAGFVHLGGALGLDALAPLRALGCAVGSWHPFTPFAAARPPEAFV